MMREEWHVLWLAMIVSASLQAAIMFCILQRFKLIWEVGKLTLNMGDFKISGFLRV